MRSLLALILLLLLFGASAMAATDEQAFEQIARGRYLAHLADCSACHTMQGGKPYAGGRPIATPFGTLLAPNLTPDRKTGIGGWSDDAFVSAVRDGIDDGGNHLYPAMPYPFYTKMSRADVLAIRAFLATLEPVRNKVHANQLPFPFSIRAAMAAWNWLYFTPGEFKPVAGKPEQWNRGAYLVEGPGHCGACHTPKNFLGADETSHTLQGGVLQGWFSPDVTGDKRRGVGGWTDEDIVAFLQSGHNRFSAATGPMSEVIKDSTSKLSEADLKAIATYLRDEKGAGEGKTPAKPEDTLMKTGEAVYVDNCAACHGTNGSGVQGLFPTLAGSAMAQQTDTTSLIRILLDGTQSVATARAPTGAAMPSFAWKLDDAEAAAVLTYIRNSWGNSAAAVSPGDVKSGREAKGE